MKKVFVFACLALLAVGGTAFGQGTKGAITVTVVDDSGAGIPGAIVEAKSDQTLRAATTVTSASGVATLPGLDPASNYVVTTTMDRLQRRAQRQRPGRLGPDDSRSG